ncbi:MAG: glycosyltransferase family 39 protein [Clostridia bacterium]|nr:glycosyltransferase family 39 protein [Clostridia bacterium]
MTKRKTNTFLVLILVLCVVSVIFQGVRKSGFHCDEIYTCGLSNYEGGVAYKTTNPDGSIKWNTSKDYEEYLTVSEETRFDYAQVLQNQRDDVHPPLYYLIYHTVSSFFIGSYSKYIGMSINLLFTLGTVILLYFIASKLFKEKKKALLATLVYALCANCINMTIYVRMYAAFVFFATVFFYLHIRFYENEYNYTAPLAVLMGVCTILGSATHYYFFLFVIPMFLYTTVSLIRKKEFKKLIIYCIPFVAAAIIYIVLWPTVFDHLFGSYRGKEAFNNATKSGFFKNLGLNIGIIFTSQGIVTTILFIVSLILTLRKNKKFKYMGVVVVCTIVYFLLTTKIAPYQTDRYLAPIFPLLAVLISHFLIEALEIIKVKKMSAVAAVAIVALIVDMSMCFGLKIFESLNYIYPHSHETKQFTVNNKGKRCVAIVTHEAHFLINLQEFNNYSETAFVHIDDVDKLLKDEKFINENEIVLYINDGIDNKNLLEEIIFKTEFESYDELISDRNRHWANSTVLRK